MKIEKELNKWQIICHLKKDFCCFPYKFIFEFGIFNIQKFPKEGEMLSKTYYKGFLFSKSFWHPLTKLKTFLEEKGY